MTLDHAVLVIKDTLKKEYFLMPDEAAAHKYFFDNYVTRLVQNILLGDKSEPEFNDYISIIGYANPYSTFTVYTPFDITGNGERYIEKNAIGIFQFLLDNKGLHITDVDLHNGKRNFTLDDLELGFEPMVTHNATWDKFIQQATIFFNATGVFNFSQEDPIHPSYYGKEGMQPIDYINTYDLDFQLGNALKYITRAGKKSTNATEDLKKAIWFIESEIKKLDKDTEDAD